MSTVISTVKLHLNRREVTFVAPLSIVTFVAVISVGISLIFLRAGSQPGTTEWIRASRSSPGLPYALVGFLISLGVTSVATTFPFALTLGSTRRAFVAGTLVWDAITAAYITLILAVLTVIELATGHWFAGFYIFDVYVLGAGHIPRLLAQVFLGVLTSLTLGGVFAASWVRFGARGPQLIAVAIVIALIVGAIIVVPQAGVIGAALQPWWLAVAAVALIVICSIGTSLLLRPATVR